MKDDSPMMNAKFLLDSIIIFGEAYSMANNKRDIS